MSHQDEHNSGVGPLKRPRYFPRQQVRAEDLTAGQDYLRVRLRRHNRLLHGFGVVCGLEVTEVGESEGHPTLTISPGYALSPDGDEIFVPEEQIYLLDCIENVAGDCLDLGEEPASETVYLVVRYQEVAVEPVPALPEQCAPRTSCEESRWCEGFAFACLDTLPELYDDSLDCESLVTALQQGETGGCLLEESGSEVLLACLQLNRDDGGELSIEVDHDCRRVIHSALTLGDALLCALEAPTPVHHIPHHAPHHIIHHAPHHFPHHIVHHVPHHILHHIPHHVVHHAPHHVVHHAPHHIVHHAPHHIVHHLPHHFPHHLTGHFGHLVVPLASGAALEEVLELTPETGEALSAAGIEDVATLSQVHAAELSKALGVGEEEAQLLIDRAAEHQQQPPAPFHVPVEDLPGLTREMAESLRANGVPDANTLAAGDSEEVASLLEINQDAAEIIIRTAGRFVG